MRRQIVALTAASAWLLQAWLGATHVHPHTDGSHDHAAARGACHAHAHELRHAHSHAGHGHDSDAPTPVSGNEHDSSDCQICRLLAEQPLPLVTPDELADGASLPEVVTFSVDVPTLPSARLFRSRAPPGPNV